MFKHRWESYEWQSMIIILILILRYTESTLTSEIYEVPDHIWNTGSRDLNGVCKGEYIEDHSLLGGMKAGKYTKLGTVNDIFQCGNLCCKEGSCELAIMLLHPEKEIRSCFKIECYVDFGTGTCAAFHNRGSKYRPYIFRKHSTSTLIKDKDSLDYKSEKTYSSSSKNLPVIQNTETKTPFNYKLLSEVNSLNLPERGDGYCAPYTGYICSEVLDEVKRYYFSSPDVIELDSQLNQPISELRSRLSPNCFRIALDAICDHSYPLCSIHERPQPLHKCYNCKDIVYGECGEEFDEANMSSFLENMIPLCSTPGYRKNECVETMEKLQPKQNSVNEQESLVSSFALSDASPKLKESLLPRPEMEANDEAEGKPGKGGKVKPSVSANPSSDTKTSYVPSLSSSQPSSTTSTAKLHFKVTSTKAPNINLSKLNYTSTLPPVNKTQSSFTFTTTTALTTNTAPSIIKTTTAAPIKTKSAIDETDLLEGIKVSAGDDTVLILPKSSVNLFASTWPKEKKDGDYTYKWSQVLAPKGSSGYIAGENTKNVKLTKLTVSGVYRFKLEVSSVDKKKHGFGYVNVTVKKPVHINHPPRAEISSKENVIQLPTDTVILDASKSMDDDKIVSYKWEEIEGPIKKKSVFGSNTDSKILQLKGLSAGVYKFRLTVTDSNGLTDQTIASVTVKKETDYPPKANAGSDVVIRLPDNEVTLNGNKSTDDKGEEKLKYEWSKTADSPTCDMQGTDKSQLKLSRLTEGTYTFILKVTDEREHSDSARVKVVVLPEKNSPPVARAGDDKEIMFPDDSTTLDASKSTDNSKIVAFHWDQTNGPSKAQMSDQNKKKIHLSKLMVGSYIFKLTVTDDKGVTGTDIIRVHVKKVDNKNPIAVAGNDVVVYLPTRSVLLDGSKSHDDEIILSYCWTRAGLSPAAGVVINNSDHRQIMRLTNLVKGRYMFDLTVTDNKGLTGVDSVTVMVKENPKKLGLVELYLHINIESFSQESKRQLIRKISVILEVEKEYVFFEELKGSTYGRGLKIVFYVKDPNIDRILDGKYVADVLKQKVGFGGKLFGYTMQRVHPYICRNNCSEHGYCDASTKLCICDAFWTENILRANFGEKESNCDWSILYLSVALFGLFIIFIGVAWSVCFCFARNRRSRRKTRYHILRSTDHDMNKEILLIPNGNRKQRYSADSMTFSESGGSDYDKTTFEKKKNINGTLQKASTGSNEYCGDYVENNF